MCVSLRRVEQPGNNVDKKIHAEIATSVNWLVGRRPIEIIGMFLFGWTCEKRETVDIPASSRHDKTNMGL